MIIASRLSAIADEIAIVGIGETDYAADYARFRDGVRTDPYALAAEAFFRALRDSGLDRSEIDGLAVGQTTALERTGEVLGLDVGWAGQGDIVNVLMQAALAIHSGLAETVALVYGNNQRSAATQYGGPNAMGGERFFAYVYYKPWGLTSQGALYAMTASSYMAATGFSPEDLGRIVTGQRAFAAKNPNAIMRQPMTLEEYLSSRFVCEPLRLPDYCLVNDGGVALILTTRDRAKRLGRPFVLISAFGRHDLNCDATSLKPRFLDYYHQGHEIVARNTYEMAGHGPEEVDAIYAYDSFSIHLPIVVEGFGFCAPGEASALVRSGAIGPGGRWPLNSSGGMLSESYMQGWNHQVEAVRQLRGHAGARQIEGVKRAQYLSDVAGKVASIVYRRAEL